MLDIEEVTYTYAAITCDWPNCDNRISLYPAPEDVGREARDILAIRAMAARQGWIIKNRGHVAYCSCHPQKEEK